MMVPAPEDDDDLGPEPTYGGHQIDQRHRSSRLQNISQGQGLQQVAAGAIRQQMIKGLNPRALRDPVMPVPAPEGMDDDAIEELMAVQPEKDPEVKAEAATGADEGRDVAAWAHYFDDQGYLYYNSKTGETSWDPRRVEGRDGGELGSEAGRGASRRRRRRSAPGAEPRSAGASSGRKRARRRGRPGRERLGRCGGSTIAAATARGGRQGRARSARAAGAAGRVWAR